MKDSAHTHTHRHTLCLELVYVCVCVCVGTWPTDGGLNPRLFQDRDSVDGSLDVLHKHVPVQVEEAEGEFITDLREKITAHNSRSVTGGWAGSP